ncbi:hypothetical protein [Neptuniibacter sp. QD37_11]|uniref:hypothetical protein n=1 Tax=Neptuniibacter sp. QD37_11 TaxID=3398209 RepID=UPI0039F4D2AF
MSIDRFSGDCPGCTKAINAAPVHLEMLSEVVVNGEVVASDYEVVCTAGCCEKAVLGVIPGPIEV